jgi:peptidoglycan/LPS O-acetylase OafA/YrhL
MVVCIHLLSEPVTRFEKGTWQYAVAFVPQQLMFVSVYGFVFLSGLKLFIRPQVEKLRVFYKKRFVSIVVPYLVAVTVYYLIFHFSYGYSFTIENILRYYLLGRIASHMYFVVAIVQFYLLMPLWRWLLNKYGYQIPVLTSLLVMLLYRQLLVFVFKVYLPNHQLKYTDRFFLTYIAFWLMGCAAGMNYDAFCKMLSRNFSLLVTAAVISGSAFAFFMLPREEALDGNVYELLRMSYIIIMIFTLYAAALKTRRLSVFSSKPFQWLDKNSYHVYLYHMICLIGSGYLLDKIGIFQTVVRFPIKFVLTFGLTFGVCLVLGQLRRLRRPVKKSPAN